MSTTLLIPIDRFDHPGYLADRLGHAPASARGALRTALRFLYKTDGPENLPRDRLKLAEQWLEPAEVVVARWLYTRTNGSLRASYGKPALRQARTQSYRCEHCGHADVRVLNLDHVRGRTDSLAFAFLCTNCHALKSRAKDWTGLPAVVEDVATRSV
jgi:hypothetical protein